MLFLFFISTVAAAQFSELDEDKPYCPMCKASIQKAIAYVEKYGVEALKEYLISNYCDKLPKTQKALCSKYVEKQLISLAHWIENQLSPEQICQSLGFCEKQRIPTLLEILDSLPEIFV